MKKRYQSGFTLVELLIVIVIIGILAAIVISIINPAKQQARARDAGIKSTVNKLALSAKAYIVTFGRIPDEIAFFGDIANARELVTGTTCSTVNGDECIFSVTGIQLPDTCQSNQWNDASTHDGSAQCMFRYSRTATRFRIFVKSSADRRRMFVYNFDNVEAGGNDGLFDCPDTFAEGSLLSACTRVQ